MRARRTLLKKAAALGLGTATLSLLTGLAHAQPKYTISAQQLQAVVAERFPLRYPVGGLLSLAMQAPALRLLPATNRLGADMQIEASGPALGRPYAGSADVDFALRYEASDKTIRAYRLKVNALRMQGLPPEASMLLSAYGGALVEQALLEVVVHTLRPQDLQLAETMGLKPGDITVTDQGVVVNFVMG